MRSQRERPASKDDAGRSTEPNHEPDQPASTDCIPHIGQRRNYQPDELGARHG
jgi:hypothetical protein